MAFILKPIATRLRAITSILRPIAHIVEVLAPILRLIAYHVIAIATILLPIAMRPATYNDHEQINSLMEKLRGFVKG